VESEPCVVYGKGRLGGGYLSFLYGEIMEEWRRSYMLERKQYKGMCEGYLTDGSIHQPSIDNQSTIVGNNTCYN